MSKCLFTLGTDDKPKKQFHPTLAWQGSELYITDARETQRSHIPMGDESQKLHA